MSDGSNIGWLAMPGHKPASWNPLRAREHADAETLAAQGHYPAGWACERISPGCERCYAETINKKLGTGVAYRVGAPVEHYLDQRTLAQPLRWRNPRCVFPCSMTDMFGRWVTDEQIAAVFGVMAATPRHAYVVLTKRIERAAAWLTHEDTRWRVDGKASWPLPSVLIGPSVEDQQRADERMPHAMKLAAAGWRVVVSYEPALGPVDWSKWLTCACAEFWPGQGHPPDCPIVLAPSWLLVGAESGKDRRPCEPAWIESAVDLAHASGVPVFVKQGSAHKPGQQGNLPDHVWSVKQFPGARP